MSPVAEGYVCQFCNEEVGLNDIHWCEPMNNVMNDPDLEREPNDGFGGMKFDQNKIRLELLSPWFVEEIGKVLTSGAAKYEDHNWAKGIKSSRYIGATLRHVFAYMRGEVNDPEWGYHHLAHAACCLMFLVHQDLTGFYEAYDDMPRWEDIPYQNKE